MSRARRDFGHPPSNLHGELQVGIRSEPTGAGTSLSMPTSSSSSVAGKEVVEIVLEVGPGASLGVYSPGLLPERFVAEARRAAASALDTGAVVLGGRLLVPGLLALLQPRRDGLNRATLTHVNVEPGTLP